MSICIAGMHRSGTSLMASYFLQCGYSIGEDVKGPSKGNALGHFEDLEFLEYHKELLVANKSDVYRVKKDLTVPDSFREQAREMIARRNSAHDKWAWKDPRSTLFLDFWREISPDSKFLLMYRDYELVMRSMIRRMRFRYLYTNPWVVAQAWIRYNADMIEFYAKNPEISCVVNISGFNRDYERAVPLVETALGIKLEAPYDSVYRPNQISGKANRSDGFLMDTLVKAIKNYYRKDLERVYGELETAALIPSKS